MSVEGVAERLAVVRARVAAAAVRAGRAPGGVGLVAVSKTQPPEAVREALAAGQAVFGENRVQELVAKAGECPSAARWHLVGHLQSNKIRKALPVCDLLHSVDSLELARGIDRVAGELGLFPRVLLEVNVAGEASKFGFAPAALDAALDELLRLPRIEVAGLMTVAPQVPDPEHARGFFRDLRILRDRLAGAGGVPLSELSMGMSGDFEAAIEEGATLVRVGTAIFGERPRPGG